MRKIIGIGETILDIIFKNNQPTKAVPGGSSFNTMVSLGRLNLPVCFLSEIGCDPVGDIIRDFMLKNNLSTDYMSLFAYGKTPVSMAFLNETGDASYLFYTDYPENRLDVTYPRIDEDDIVVFGSYFSINPLLRERVVDILEYARDRKAIIFYDPNFRKAHAHDAVRLMPSILENFEYADIVRGSSEDFINLYRLTDPALIYKEKIQFYTPYFIYTDGSQGADLFIRGNRTHFDALQTNVVSTIGAGDNFNAGLLYGMLKYGITRQTLKDGSSELWENAVRCGLAFAAHVCQSYDNYISDEFAVQYRD